VTDLDRLAEMVEACEPTPMEVDWADETAPRALWDVAPELIALAQDALKRIPGADRCRFCAEESPFAVAHRGGCPVAALDARLAEVLGE